jgi:hypothetical protein
LELQEILLRGIIVQLRFAVTPRFPDIRGRLIEELSEILELPEWGWGDNVFLTTVDRSVTVFASSRELRVNFEEVEDAEEHFAFAKQFFDHAGGMLGVKAVEFVGVRTFWIGAVDSFDELHKWLLDRLAASAQDVLSIVSQPPTDTGWVFEFHKEDPKHTLRVGPMTNDQAVQLGLFVQESRVRLPAEFLFIDLDRVNNEDKLDWPAAQSRWEATFRKNLEIGEKIAASLSLGKD